MLWWAWDRAVWGDVKTGLGESVPSVEDSLRPSVHRGCQKGPKSSRQVAVLRRGAA